MSININGSNDPYYRYKMDEIIINHGGQGNGVFTIINNIDEISKSINTPSEILIKYLSYHLNSNYNDKKKSFTGHHTIEFINSGLFNYINSFVMCTNCSIPELFYTLDNKKVKSKCSACGNDYECNFTNKIDNKCMDNIQKYLAKKTWNISKGNMILESKYDEIFKSFNPFII
jgi:translation initiation factor 2 beta subunit (eIF-2beta)/eIF-5